MRNASSEGVSSSGPSKMSFKEAKKSDHLRPQVIYITDRVLIGRGDACDVTW